MKQSILAITLMAFTLSAQAGPFSWLTGKKKEKTNETEITNVVAGDTRTVVLTLSLIHI